MVATHGLTHLALDVRDPEASYRFYRAVFGSRVTYRDAESVEVQTPGCRDHVVFQRAASRAGKRGGVAHFGFKLRSPRSVAAAARAVQRAGGRVTDRGEFVPGQPYLFFLDPDGYEVEVWYEP